MNCFAFSLPGWLSLEALSERASLLTEMARRDPATFGFWACVWVGSFVVTFLFLRMLFTHWGDTHVIRKTMTLSLLMHLVMGLWSTHWMLPQGSPSVPPPPEQVIRFQRRQVVHGQPLSEAQNQTDAETAGEGAGSRAFVVDSPTFGEQATRLTKRTEQPDALITPSRPMDEAIAAAPLPEMTTPQEPAAPAELQRSAPTTPRAVDIAAESAIEDTATARSEAPAEAPSARANRAAPEVSQTAPQRISRERPAEADASIGFPADTELSAAAENVSPKATVKRPVAAGESRPSGDKSPKIARAPEGAAAERGESPIQSGTTLTQAPQRVNRSGSTGFDAGPAERTRTENRTSGRGDAPLATPAAAGALPSELPTPSVARTENAGAIDKGSGRVPAPYRLRALPQRKQFAIDVGATDESERAVEASLKWLARHQHRQGYWPTIESTLGREPPEDPPITFKTEQARIERQRAGLDAETGLTGLALLAFLGANHTHRDSEFAENVHRGLKWLISQQDAEGCFAGRANRYARMYCHGMATIALGEAYGMTKDPALKAPLERAIRYIVAAQNPQDGGWRYEKGYLGDMSIFGWQLMALKSAQTAGLEIPDEAFDRAITFLVVHGRKQRTSRHSEFGGLAGYRIYLADGVEQIELPKPSMTAESLFCKQMLGIDRGHPSYDEAVGYLLQHAPRRSKQNLYYWYYGTLAMYQHGGEGWDTWNEALRDTLVADQRTDGDFAGSWNPRAPWSDFGGRVFSTALSALCLEVYYRFLPMYQRDDAATENARRDSPLRAQ